ncbi:MAG: hypothetical protein ACPGN3_06470 [Opitutales bacterium]
MKSLVCLVSLFVGFLAAGVVFAEEEKVISLQIRLSGSKNQVVSAKQRARALEIVESALQNVHLKGVDSMDGVVDPFYPEQPEEEVVVVVREVLEIEPEPEPVGIDPMDVLKSAGEELKGRVRGTLSAGANTFITTADGSFIGVGTEIPYRFEDESFVLTVDQVSDKFFTIRLENVRRRVSILDAAR